MQEAPMKPTIRWRVPELADAVSLFELRTNEAVNRYLDREPPTHISAVEQFIESRRADQTAFYYIIETLPEHAFAGTICLWNIDLVQKSGEVGFELLPRFQGKGIMSSTLHQIIQFAFTDVGLEILDAVTKKGNQPSQTLLERMGFSRAPESNDPELADYFVYRLRKGGA
jgi:ribosomal-protein-alanine N-acetyltransferase